jgi:hypothetical protein
MKRLARVIGVLGIIGVAVLMLAWDERGSFNEEATEIWCAHFGSECLSQTIFSGNSVRLFP